MNKLFNKIAASIVGIAMAVGVGVAVGSGAKEARSVRADTQVSFVAGTDTSSSTTMTKDGVTVSTTSGTFSRSDNYRIYASNSMTISSTSDITSMAFTITQNTFTANVGTWSSQDNTWTGAAKSITLAASGGQVRITSFTVTLSGGAITTHTLTYDKNDSGASGTMTDGASPYASGSTVTVLANEFTAPSGKEFDKWNTASDGSGTNYNPGDTFTISADTTLYAQWKTEVLNNEIVFDSLSTDATADITSETCLSFITSGRGYLSSFSDISKVYKGSTGLKFGSGSAAGTITFNFDTTKTASLVGLRLYAEIKDYGDGGNFVFESDEMSSSSISVAKPNALTKTAVSIFESAPETLIISTSSKRGYLKSLSFEEVSGYTVSFDSNGGTGTMTSEYDVTGSYTLPANGFTAPSGMQFAGWKVNNSGETISAGSSYTVSANVIFYAQWETSAVPDFVKITDLSTADKVIITTTKSNVHYYVPAATTSSAPAASICTISGDKVTDVDESNLFTVGTASGGYTFKNSDGKYLANINDNNGVRINATTASSWTVTATTSGFKMTNNSRWLGVYNTQNWRSYSTSNASNYGGSGEAIEFYGIAKEAAVLEAIELTNYPTSDMAISETAQLGYYGMNSDAEEWIGTVTYVSSDTSVATVDSNGLLTALSAGTTDITVYADAGTGGARVTSEAVTITVSNSYAKGTEQNPYTVAEARAAIDAGTGITNVYVTGVVSEIVTSWDSSYNNISFNISADGLTTGDQLEAFRCVSSDEHEITSDADIEVGATVVMYGSLTKYGDTYELAQGCKVHSYTSPTYVLTAITGITGTLEAPSGSSAWDLSSLTVFGSYSDGRTNQDVTALVNLSTEDVPGTVSETTTRNVAVTASPKDSESTVESYTTNVQGTINAISGLISNGQYRISATKIDEIEETETTYYLKSTGASTPVAVTEFYEATVFTFTLVDANTYTIKVGDDYLYSTNSNNGVRVGSTEDKWVIETGVAEMTGSYNFKDVNYNRYLTLYSETDWRAYTSPTATNREENTDVQAFTAAQFSSEFLSTYTAGCDNSGTYNSEKMMWSIASTQFGFLSTSDQQALAGATASEAGSIIEQAAARYDYIVGKYLKGQGIAAFNDFIGRNPTAIGSGRISIFGNMNRAESNTILVVVIASAISVAAIGGYFFLKKKKEK